ncbi:MAG: DUF309 domain-containing protein [Bacteroidota bacterium]
MDERFGRGIQEFNDRKFYEAHETLEELWHEYREDDRKFLQGLIQLAAGAYHLGYGNLTGAHSQFSKALEKIAPYQPVHYHIDVRRLVLELTRCRDAVAGARSRNDTGPGISHIPTICSVNSLPDQINP